MNVSTTATLAGARGSHPGGGLHGPHIDWAALSPFMVLAIGAMVVLLVGLLHGKVARERIVPALTLIVLAGAVGTEIWRFTSPAQAIVAGALRLDSLALIIDFSCAAAAAASVLLAWRSLAPREAGHGEYHCLILFSVFGMAVLASADDLVTLFLGIELLSIPLYVLCASEHRREGSLESGLKYLVIGSVGSATLVYGLALIYGATGQTGLPAIAAAVTHSSHVADDALLLTGIGLAAVGFAFKASVAPFHQWTPDVYQGAPTPVTTFMATATKAAALAILVRFFDVTMIANQHKWAPLLAALATMTIIVGNVGALGQSSLKRMLGYSGVAQAGYMLAGVVVGTKLGAQATVFYVIAYLVMNIAAFAVLHAVETEHGSDDVNHLAGLSRRSPLLGWALAIPMLGLAGIPGTVGFIGKFQLIHALVDGGYTWLAIVLVVGAMISLGYYLRVIAVAWMRDPASGVRTYYGAREPTVPPPIAGGSPEADALPHAEVLLVAAIFAAASVVLGVLPGPLFNLAAHVGSVVPGLL